MIRGVLAGRPRRDARRRERLHSANAAIRPTSPWRRALALMFGVLSVVLVAAPFIGFVVLSRTLDAPVPQSLHSGAITFFHNHGSERPTFHLSVDLAEDSKSIEISLLACEPGGTTTSSHLSGLLVVADGARLIHPEVERLVDFGDGTEWEAAHPLHAPSVGVQLPVPGPSQVY